MMMRTVISTKRQKDTHGILYEADVVGVGVLDDDQLVVLLHVLHPLGCLQPSSLDDEKTNFLPDECCDDDADDDEVIACWQKIIHWFPYLCSDEYSLVCITSTVCFVDTELFINQSSSSSSSLPSS